MVPYYQDRHERQAVGLEGPDLAGQRERQLMSGARGTPRDSIQQFDSAHFHVASQSRPGTYYEIDLDQSACNCPDFPRSRFCKHLAAIYVHFPSCKRESSPSIDLKSLGLLDPQQRIPTPEVRRTSSPQESLQKLMQDIKLLSQQLDDKIGGLTDESAPAVIQAVRSVKYSLTAAIASTQGSRALPDQEKLAPNQKTWPETAVLMGVKRVPKRRLPGEHGITERSIGAPKKRKRVYTDAYAAGERSGKHAKPDALSAAANSRARAPPAPPMLPSPSTLPPTPALAAARIPAGCIPGSPGSFPWGFPLAPGSATARAPPAALGSRSAASPFGARDFDLGAAPFALGTIPGDPVLAPARTFPKII